MKRSVGGRDEEKWVEGMKGSVGGRDEEKCGQKG